MTENNVTQMKNEKPNNRKEQECEKAEQRDKRRDREKQRNRGKRVKEIREQTIDTALRF